jgi:hypothetical protein
VFIDFDDAPIETMHITVVINDHGEKAANEAAAIDRGQGAGAATGGA